MSNKSKEEAFKRAMGLKSKVANNEIIPDATEQKRIAINSIAGEFISEELNDFLGNHSGSGRDFNRGSAKLGLARELGLITPEEANTLGFLSPRFRRFGDLMIYR